MVYPAEGLELIENGIFDAYGISEDPKNVEAVFILSAPRSGSTFLYQMIARSFNMPSISNLTNEHFPSNPIVGFSIQKSCKVHISTESSYGKTSGLFQPSEGSAVLKNWFGGGHPSQLVSAQIHLWKAAHFRRTLAGAHAMFEMPLVIKNAWNCFRIASLAQILPHARFIWLLRDIASAATSDLAARYATKGDPNAWNSATPASYKELGKLPPTAQVVENQHEFNTAIGNDLRHHAAGRWHCVWYEDLLEKPDQVLLAVARFLNLGDGARELDAENLRVASQSALSLDEQAAIERYVHSSSRFAAWRWPRSSAVG